VFLNNATLANIHYLGQKLPKPSICIISPGLATANNGNWQTAHRWRQMLSSDSHVEIMLQWDDATGSKPFDAMLALHARRSADSIAKWSTKFPDKLIVLALTGTDLYRDIVVDPLAQQSLKLAHRLVVLQDMGPKSLPAEFQSKCQVIFQSTPRRKSVQKTTSKLRALMVGHLRSEKSPETYFAAARALAHRSDIVLDHIGAPLDAELGEQARQLAAEVPTYRYLGEQTHAQTRARIARAHVLVHPSRMEGGAHVVMEAVMSGTPVLASRIDGNVGMLGADYEGYFDCGDALQLTKTLIECREGQNQPSNKLDQLARQCIHREKLFEPLAEKTALLRIVAEKP
jgi:putative glycosyltransferase (TIGR04348 family)